jgi:hypothetical protein
MIFRIVLLLGLMLLYFYCRNRYQNTAKDRRKQLLLNWVLWASVAGILVMALTGRLHWIGALLAVAVPFVRQFGLWLMQRYLSRSQASNEQDQSPGKPPMPHQTLTPEDAMKLLNLEPGFSPADLVQAHRRMMQKNHPDQGGSDYLAAMINQAKDVLLKTSDH